MIEKFDIGDIVRLKRGECHYRIAHINFDAEAVMISLNSGCMVKRVLTDLVIITKTEKKIPQRSVAEAYAKGLLCTGVRIRSNASRESFDRPIYTGTFEYFSGEEFFIRRDDGVRGRGRDDEWCISVKNTTAFIEVLLNEEATKSGDTVRFIKEGACGNESRLTPDFPLPYESDELVIGHSYIVEATAGNYMQLMGTPMGLHHHKDHFELVAEDT